MYETSKDKDIVPDIILQSDVYKIIKEKIARKEVIKDDDNLWYDIEETILKCSPKLMENLNLLAMGHLSRLELHTIFLIKCGLKPSSEMPFLLGRSQGTVVSRRQAICIKLFGETMNVKILDAIIRQL